MASKAPGPSRRAARTACTRRDCRRARCPARRCGIGSAVSSPRIRLTQRCSSLPPLGDSQSPAPTSLIHTLRRPSVQTRLPCRRHGLRRQRDRRPLRPPVDRVGCVHGGSWRILQRRLTKKAQVRCGCRSGVCAELSARAGSASERPLSAQGIERRQITGAGKPVGAGDLLTHAGPRVRCLGGDAPSGGRRSQGSPAPGPPLPAIATRCCHPSTRRVEPRAHAPRAAAWSPNRACPKPHLGPPPWRAPQLALPSGKRRPRRRGPPRPLSALRKGGSARFRSALEPSKHVFRFESEPETRIPHTSELRARISGRTSLRAPLQTPGGACVRNRPKNLWSHTPGEKQGLRGQLASTPLGANVWALARGRARTTSC